jgi:hypothetical protein
MFCIFAYSLPRNEFTEPFPSNWYMRHIMFKNLDFDIRTLLSNCRTKNFQFYSAKVVVIERSEKKFFNVHKILLEQRYKNRSEDIAHTFPCTVDGLQPLLRRCVIFI